MKQLLIFDYIPEYDQYIGLPLRTSLNQSLNITSIQITRGKYIIYLENRVVKEFSSNEAMHMYLLHNLLQFPTLASCKTTRAGLHTSLPKIK